MSKDTILSSIEDAVEDFRQGKFLIVVDDEDRENEGDFIIAAEAITPEKDNLCWLTAEEFCVLPLPCSVVKN